ncbi:hypothetical protein B0H14DRAFT_2556137 [Mycena olivaceomarginata]|nr:hypothetical protein B0H14DRAFT_2556137 [Mycena olivaceomarginata]
MIEGALHGSGERVACPLRADARDSGLDIDNAVAWKRSVRRARDARKGGGSGSGPKDSEAERDNEVMDPDEVVMFFWSQNLAALERRKREAEDRKRQEEKRASRMEDWRNSVVAI